MAVAVGQRIEARCTRCKDLMGHVVVSMLGGEIAKVECCACGSVHKYYPPAKKKEEAQTKPVRVRAGEARSAAVKESSQRSAKISNLKALEEMQAKWKDRMVSYSGNAKPYSMDLLVKKDDFVEHGVFGVGVVVEICPPNKADILFSLGIKSLRCLCE